MHKRNGLLTCACLAAAMAAVLSSCSSGIAQEIKPPKGLPDDIFRDLRAFGDMVETKERPWGEIDKRKPKVGSQKNKDFIDQLKKLHESFDNGLNGRAVQSLSKQIRDLDLDVSTKVSLVKLSDRGLHPDLDAKSRRVTLWYMADLVIEKSKGP